MGIIALETIGLGLRPRPIVSRAIYAHKPPPDREISNTYTADDIETTEGNSGNGTFDEDPDPSDTHNSDPLSLLELLENEIEDDLLETAPVSIPTSIRTPTTVEPSTHNNLQLSISHVPSPTTPNAPVSIPTSISTPTTVQPSTHNNSL